jgi:hypothetical protein
MTKVHVSKDLDVGAVVVSAFSLALKPGFLCEFSGLEKQSTDFCPCLPQRLQLFLNCLGNFFPFGGGVATSITDPFGVSFLLVWRTSKIFL